MTNEFLFASKGKNDECYTHRYGVEPLLDDGHYVFGIDGYRSFSVHGKFTSGFCLTLFYHCEPKSQGGY